MDARSRENDPKLFKGWGKAVNEAEGFNLEPN